MKKSLRTRIENTLKSTWLNKLVLQEQNPEDDVDGTLLDTIYLTGDSDSYNPDIDDSDWDGIPDNFDNYEDPPDIDLDFLDYEYDPDAEDEYYTNECQAYGCMDSQAYNYNPDAGPWVWCNTFCHYNEPIGQQDQNYADEALNCNAMGDQIGGAWTPCYVNNGYSYNTVPGYGGGAPGGVQLSGYIVECCQAGWQQCSSSFGCVGEVNVQVLDIGGNDNDNDFDIPDELICNAENSGCRSPQWANFHPDHVCDCDMNYIGQWPEVNFAGNTDCCNNNLLQICPDGDCLWDGFEEGAFGDLCFTPDSLVIMEDGTSKPINQVEVGEIVKSEIGFSKVIGIDIHKGTFDVYSINHKEAFVTEEHPFKTIEGWKAINPIETFRLHQVNSNILKEGDTIIRIDGEEKVNSIVKGEPVNEVYNLRLNNEHVYYVNGYLVHNGKGDEEGPIVDPVGPPGAVGCTDPNAGNYDPQAQEDDGSCMYHTMAEPSNNNSGQVTPNRLYVGDVNPEEEPLKANPETGKITKDRPVVKPEKTELLKKQEKEAKEKEKSNKKQKDIRRDKSKEDEIPMNEELKRFNQLIK